MGLKETKLCYNSVFALKIIQRGRNGVSVAELHALCGNPTVMFSHSSKVFLRVPYISFGVVIERCARRDGNDLYLAFKVNSFFNLTGFIHFGVDLKLGVASKGNINSRSPWHWRRVGRKFRSGAPREVRHTSHDIDSSVPLEDFTSSAAGVCCRILLQRGCALDDATYSCTVYVERSNICRLAINFKLFSVGSADLQTTEESTTH